MTANPYQRLPGRASSFGAQYRIYRTTDHLLTVAIHGFTESYKRFHFRDIQAIMVERTSTGAIFNAILGFPAFICAIFWAYLLLNWQTQTVENIAPATVFAVLLGVPLVINLLLGPTCRCYVKTAVQTERLYAIGRLRTAGKFTESVRPLIAEAQVPRTPAGSSPTSSAEPIPEPPPATGESEQTA